MPECLSCEIFTQLDALAQGYGQQAFGVIAPPTQVTFNAFVGVWFAWMFAVEGALLGKLTFQRIAPSIATFTLCGIVLNSSGLYWEWVFKPMYAAMNGIATTLVLGNVTGVDAQDITGMLTAVEGQVSKVLGVAQAIMQDAGITTLWLLVAGAVLAVPYVFVWGIFLAFVLEGIFKLLAITAVSPLLIAATAFKPSRGFAISGFRVMLGGTLTVVFAAVAMGFTLHVMQDFIQRIPVQEGGFQLDIEGWVLGAGYWSMLLLGFISVLFHLKAATLAANISGASDGPGAAAAVVAGGMTALATLKGVGVWGSRRAAILTGSAAGAIGNAGRETHDRIWQRPNTKIANSSSK
jgi:hypothetical protein